MNTVSVKLSKDGKTFTEEVVAFTHENCEGLAVTMAEFGLFNVTHIATGLMIGGKYERAGSAALLMSELYLISKACGFSWSETDVQHHMSSDEEVPFEDATILDSAGTRKMTISEWIRNIYIMKFFGGGVSDEFPWESETPIDKALEILEPSV